MHLSQPRIEVSIGTQTLGLWDGTRLVKQWPCSTSKFGIGFREGSNQTPLGAKPDDPVALRLAANLIRYAAGYQRRARPTVVVLPAADPRRALLAASGLKFTGSDDPVAALETGEVVIVDGTPGNLAKFVAEESAIATLNERLAVLDRAVDAYTKLGAGGLFQFDKIKKGQELQAQQRPAREAISAELATQRARIEELRLEHIKQQAKAREVITSDLAAQRTHIEQLRADHAKQQVKARADISSELATVRARIEQLRTEHAKQQVKARDTITTELVERRANIDQLRSGYAKQVDAADREAVAVRERFTQETARLDAEEQETRKTGMAEVAEVEKQLKAMQSQGLATVSTGDSQSESLYQRIRTRNEDIHRLRGQIAAVDIGSYRFVARAFDATADGVVKWLMLALVLVFDPLAV